MEKKIAIECLSTPDDPGYPDKVVVTTNGEMLFHSPAGACPNPREPWLKGGRPWPQAYGWLGLGSYTYEAVYSRKRGLWLVLDGGGRVASRTPNPRHDGLRYLAGVGLHRGWTADWRGSAGCLTIPPSAWGDFVSLFTVGDRGELHVLDFHPRRYEAVADQCKRASVCPMFETVGGIL